MSKGKLYRYEAIKSMDIVHEYPENIAGKWDSTFNRQAPLILELACGRGEYSIGLSQIHPENNYLGVDIKGERLFVGAREVKRQHLEHVQFLRTQIDKIDEYFEPQEVDEIWLPFPDPQLRFSKMGKRLTHPKFLRKYQQFIKKDAPIHLKTDSPSLYYFTKAVIQYFNLSLLEDINNIYSLEDVKDTLKIETFYQKLDIAGQNKAHYLKFKIDHDIPETLPDDFKDFIKQYIDKHLTENG